jgi:hypothetical protein
MLNRSGGSSNPGFTIFALREIVGSSDTRLVLTEPDKINSGFILVSANGGLNQQRVAVRIY